MQCIICKGKQTTGKDQAEICYNCFGSGELEGIKTTESPSEAAAVEGNYFDKEVTP